MQKKYWFKAKKYGLGWVPCSWQGWVVTLGYAAAVLWYAIRLETSGEEIELGVDLFGPFFLAIVTFLTIAWRTGEPLKWRWSGKAKEEVGEDSYETFK